MRLKTKAGTQVKKYLWNLWSAYMDSRKISIVKQKTLSSMIRLQAIKSKPEIKSKHQSNYLNGKGDMADFSLPHIFTSWHNMLVCSKFLDCGCWPHIFPQSQRMQSGSCEVLKIYCALPYSLHTLCLQGQVTSIHLLKLSQIIQIYYHQ